MKRKYKSKWIKKHHGVTFWVIRCIFKPFFLLRYRLKPANDKRKIPSPSILMANHQTTYDQFIVACSVKRPTYFIASEDLFMNPILAPLMKYFMAPIAKSKSKSDIGTIMNTKRVLKEGGIVALFPEGNRTLSGGCWGIDISTAKLAKACKVPLVLYKIDGGYGTDPRWGGKIRRGKMQAKTVEILSVEQLENMSVEEVNQKINATITSNDYEQGVEFKSRKRAEYLERALYYCPNCKSFESLYSKGNYLKCKNCSMVVEYTKDLYIKALDGVVPYQNVYGWFNEQKIKLSERVKKGEVLFSDDKIIKRVIYQNKWHKGGIVSIKADGKGIILQGEDGKTQAIGYEEIVGATVLGKRKINYYLKDDKTLQFEGNKRFCAIKYLHLLECVKEETDG